jgi:hypothetical protein
LTGRGKNKEGKLKPPREPVNGANSTVSKSQIPFASPILPILMGEGRKLGSWALKLLELFEWAINIQKFGLHSIILKRAGCRLSIG